MRQIVLAKLTLEEVDKILGLEENYYTFVALSNNKYLSCDEKKDAQQKATNYKCEIETLYENIRKKYKLPMLNNVGYKLSANTYELYVEVN